MSIKEFFVFADPDSNLYHLTVEGSVVKDGARLSPPVRFNLYWIIYFCHLVLSVNDFFVIVIIFFPEE